MKKLKIAVFSALLIIFTGVCAFNNINVVNADNNYSDYKELSIALLHPHIEKAIENYYGYNRRYEIGDSKLEISERNGNVFTVKVKVDTFEGAHNDYYTEILTFTVTTLSVTLEEYLHSDFYK